MRRTAWSWGMLIVVGALVGAAARDARAQDPGRPGPDTVVFTPERGKVTFTHGAHAKAAASCEACHHASRPERPDSLKNQKCSTCHTAEPTPPMKTSRKLAFHDTENRAGTCYGCHLKAADEGKTVPAKCSDCHKRDEGNGGGLTARRSMSRATWAHRR